MPVTCVADALDRSQAIADALDRSQATEGVFCELPCLGFLTVLPTLF